MVSLRPVAGSDREIVDALRAWLEAPSDPDPLIIETSGSTGNPKRVLLTRAAIVSSVAATRGRLGAEGVWLLTLPVSYVAGLQVVARSLIAGHEPVLVADHSSFAAAFAVAPEAPRFTSLVSTQLGSLLDSPADRQALQMCHAVLLGGGPIDPLVRARAEDFGIKVVATYGSSETAGGCVYDGWPLDGVAVEVAPDGQIRIAGPMLFAGYDGDPALTAEVLKDGWFHSSDRGEIDDQGRLRVVGRLDDVIISGGVKVPASVVASRLREHPDIDRAEVIGVPDGHWGERVAAAVVWRRSLNDRLGLVELRDFVAERMPRHWAPRQLLVVEQIPVTSAGKPDRSALIELAESNA
jgi:o-succinylbenzoate---CoA ligase